MKVKIEYLKKTHYIRGCLIEEWEEIPSSKIGFTGRYTIVNGEMVVEICEEKNLPRSIMEFILRKKPRTYPHTTHVHEDKFRFFEIEHFDCRPETP